MIFFSTVLTRRNREGGSRGETERESRQNLPLAITFAFISLFEQSTFRGGTREGRNEGESKAHHTGPTWPVWSVLKGFSLLSIFSQSAERPHEQRGMASRNNKFSPCFLLLAPHNRLTENFSWVSEGPSLLKETQHSNSYFCRWSNLGSHTRPAGLKQQPAFCDQYNHTWKTRHDCGIIRPHQEGRAWRPDDSRSHDGPWGYG